MKRLLALLLALVMILALAACGEDKKDDGKDDKDKTSDNATKDDGSKTTTPSTPAVDDSYLEALQLFMDGFYGIDTDNLALAAPESLWAENEYLMNDAVWLAESNYETMASLAGEDFTVTIKDSAKSAVSDADRAAVIAAFDEQKGITLEDLAIVTATVDIAGSVGSDSVPLEANMVKIDGEWYVAEWYVYDEGCYVMFKVETMVGG